MFGWFKDKFMNKSDLRTDERKEVIERLTRAQKEIERSKKLLRASGYYNDRLEGTHEFGRNT